MLAALAFAIAVAAEPRWSAEFFRQNQLTWQIAAFAVVVAAGSTRLMHAPLSSPPLVAIGLASYSIYFVHEPLIGLLAHNTSLAPLPIAAIAIGCGFVFWVFAERPFVNTRLQAALVGRLEPVLRRLVRFGGVPRRTRPALGSPASGGHGRPCRPSSRRGARDPGCEVSHRAGARNLI
ncbi:MAG: hypothetical protein M3Z37_01410 [Candidatus Eremiobacteraeota bacterium]|nr:hypothetical protein [Candidatus Eremiobacteraeota bacterium]